MKSHIKSFATFSINSAVALVAIAALAFASATTIHAQFSEPTATPPGNNTLAPINTGPSQTKTGGLSLGALLVNGGSQLIGNVGIGVGAATDAALNISRDGGRIKLGTGTNTSGYELQIGSNDNGVNFTAASAARGFNFSNNVGRILTLLPNGNIGIGTTSIDSKLDISGRVDIVPGSQFLGQGLRIFSNSGSEHYNIHTFDTGDFALRKGGNPFDVIGVDQTGTRVQIGGGRSPAAGLALDVQGSLGADQYCDGTGANCVLAADLSGGDDLGAGGTTVGTLYSNNATGFGYVGTSPTDTFIRFDGANGQDINIANDGAFTYAFRPGAFFSFNPLNLGISTNRWANIWGINQNLSGTLSVNGVATMNDALIVNQGSNFDVWLQGGISTTGGDARNLALLGEKGVDRLRINYNSEYTGGVRIEGNVAIGSVNPSSNALQVAGNIGSATAPTAGDHLTNKTYVDSTVATAVAGAGDDLGAGGTTDGVIFSRNATDFGYVGNQFTGSHLRFDGPTSGNDINVNVDGSSYDYYFNASSFGPYSSRNLGSTSNRWSTIYVDNGDFSGSVTVPTAPTAGDHLTNKTYVDSTVATAVSGAGDDLGAGGTTTGTLYSKNTSGNGYIGADATDYIRFIDNNSILTTINNVTSYVQTPTAYYPNTNNGATLGLSTRRWSNLWAQDANFSGSVDVGSNLTANNFTAIGGVGYAWEGGVNSITHNDGGGNVQIRFGNDFSSSAERFTHDGTAFYVGGPLDSAAGELQLKVASNGGAGNDSVVSWGSTLTIGDDYLRWTGPLASTGNDLTTKNYVDAQITTAVAGAGDDLGAGGSTNGSIAINNSSPTITLNDITSGEDGYFIHNNSDRLYFLKNDGTGGWTADRPLTLINGSVGINTAVPNAAYSLDVNGSARVRNVISDAPASNPSSGIDTFAFRASGSFGGGIGLTDGSGNWGLYTNSGGANLILASGSNLGALTTRVTFGNNGNIAASTAPTAGAHLTNKTYVDSTVATAVAGAGDDLGAGGTTAGTVYSNGGRFGYFGSGASNYIRYDDVGNNTITHLGGNWRKVETATGVYPFADNGLSSGLSNRRWSTVFASSLNITGASDLGAVRINPTSPFQGQSLVFNSANGSHSYLYHTYDDGTFGIRKSGLAQDVLNFNANGVDIAVRGNVVASTAPTAGSHLTNKTYVDSTVATAVAGAGDDLGAGGTTTGDLYTTNRNVGFSANSRHRYENPYVGTYADGTLSTLTYANSFLPFGAGKTIGIDNAQRRWANVFSVDANFTGRVTTGGLTFTQSANHRINTNAGGLLFDGGDGSYDVLIYDDAIFSDRIILGYTDSATLTTYNTNENLTIDPNGSGQTNVVGTLTATAFIYSDKNLKENIEKLGDVKKILDLNAYSFSWNKEATEKYEKEGSDFGLIAQEVEELYPEAVNTDSETGHKSVDYARLVAPLLEITKEQEERINNLERRLEALEAK